MSIIKSVCFLLVTICITSFTNAQFPNLPFPFPGGGIPGIPFPFPFGPSPGGIPGMLFPFPFGPSPGGMPRMPFPFPFGPSPGGSPRIPFPFPFGPSPGKVGSPGMDKCWSTITMDMPACVAEIRQSIMTGKVGHIGPACCKVFQDAEANCAHNLPLDPMLKQKCSPAAAPSPTTL